MMTRKAALLGPQPPGMLHPKPPRKVTLAAGLWSARGRACLAICFPGYRFPGTDGTQNFLTMSVSCGGCRMAEAQPGLFRPHFLHSPPYGGFISEFSKKNCFIWLAAQHLTGGNPEHLGEVKKHFFCSVFFFPHPTLGIEPRALHV